FEAGAQAAANIRAKIREMREERGIEVGYLAAGIASWTEATQAGTETFTAPVMLLPVSLRTRADTNDYEIQFDAQAGLNRALVRHFDTVHGIQLDPAEFHRASYVTARFDVVPAAELLTK